MYYSENIGKIRRFFTKEKSYVESDFISDFDSSLKCKVLALLLLNADLATPELNRDNVSLLLDGKLEWPKSDGSKYCAKIDVELYLLERFGAITFYAGYCKVHSKRVSNYYAISDSAKPMYDALELIKSILYGEGFVRPYFSINKKYAKELVEISSILIELDSFEGVIPEGENYRIELNSFRRSNLLPEFLWKEFVTSLNLSSESTDTHVLNFNEAQRTLLNKWLLICRVYSDNYLTGIDFKYIEHDHKRVFLRFFELLLINDEQLTQPKYILKNKWRCNSQFEDIFFEIDQSIRMNFSSSGETNISPVQQLPIPLSIGEIQSKFFTSDTVDDSSNLEFVRNWARNGRFIDNDNSLYINLLMQFVKSDIYIDSSSLNSFGQLDNLLENSTERAELRHILLNDLPGYSGIKYLLYLLTKQETATAAVYIFFKKSLNNLIDLPHGELGAYHLTFFPVVCDEFLDVCFNSKFKKTPEKDIVDLLIFMAVDSIHNGYSGELSKKQDCLDILLGKFTTEQVSYFSEFLFSELEHSVDRADKNFAVAEVYLLFWLLGKSQDFNLSNGSDFSNKIQNLIAELYISAFKNNLGEKDNKINAYKMFNFIPWWRIDDEHLSEYLELIKKPSSWALKLAGSNSYQHQNKNLARNYLQLLVGLHSEKRAIDVNESITSKVLSLIESCGFPEDSQSCGLFDYGYPGEYPLWEQFILTVDRMSDVLFDRLLSILESGVPINRSLELYEKITKEARKKKILAYIKNPSDTTIDSLGIATLEETLDSACRTGQVDIAQIMLEKGLSLLNNEDSYLKNRSSSAHISMLQDKWRSYDFKINLWMVVRENSLSGEQKLEKIQGLKQPFKQERSHHLRLNLAGSCNRFQRNMRALILHEINPETAYKYFHALYLEDRSIYYSGNRLASKLAYLDANETNVDSGYRDALNEWLDSIDGCDVQEVDCNFIKNWLYCLIKNNDLRGIDALWSKLSEAQQNNIPVVSCYCKSLIQRGQYHFANLIFEKLKKYHSVVYLGDEAEKQLYELSEMIVNDHQPVVIAELTKIITERPKSTDELRRSYQEIRVKKLSEIVCILEGEGTTVERFLYEKILSIVKEIQIRKSNLNLIRGNEIKFSSRIIKEDLINDWLTSLFDLKLSHLGLSCRDQKRGGQSSSKENPGEIDFFLCDHKNGRIAIMEAFRLFSNDTTVINNHLNKVAGYDQECLSPVFIIAYCDVADFPGLCANYHSDNQEREYNGYSKSLSKKDAFRVIEDSPTVTKYEETRFRGSKPIVFYHFMVNLRFQS